MIIFPILKKFISIIIRNEFWTIIFLAPGAGPNLEKSFEKNK